MTYWYISFASDRGFLGATVVEARSARAAVREATKRGLNPGGEAAILEVPRGAENEPDVLMMLNRLAGRAEMIASGGMRNADLPQEIQDVFAAEAVTICEPCNEAVMPSGFTTVPKYRIN